MVTVGANECSRGSSPGYFVPDAVGVVVGSDPLEKVPVRSAVAAAVGIGSSYDGIGYG